MYDQLIRALASAAQFACKRISPPCLKALHESVEEACQLSAETGWDQKAAAHAAFFSVLGEAADDPVIVQVLVSGSEFAYDLMMMAGGAAHGIVIISRRRFLERLRAGDADGAAQALEEHLRTLEFMCRLAGRVRGGLRHWAEYVALVRYDGRGRQVRAQSSRRRANPPVSVSAPTRRDETGRPRLHEEALPRDSRDSLADLSNRAQLAESAAYALSLAQRSGKIVAMMFLDIDDFKEVNDTRGHAVGDELLAEFGRRLERLARRTHAVTRMSGDEFAMLADNFARLDEVGIFADRIVNAFAAPFTLSDGSVFVSATVGVATSDDSDSADELLRHADLALHAAKSSGKRRWQHYTPSLSAAMEKRHGMRCALEQAVRDSALLEQVTCGSASPEQVASDCSFTLAYQPIVSFESGLIVGFEALLRWPHPTLGLLMPGQFIKIAEETGLIVPIGAWAIRRALCDLAAGGPHTGATHPYVSVNVSARQFRSPNFVATVREALALSGLPSSALVLELTESALIPHEGVAALELAELTELGVRLAIDDFGTGYSSFSYLHELPIDILKIDRSFVEGFAVSHQQLAIVQGVISIARNLGIEVVAEGIETADQREMLAATGCDYGQGYLLAMPMEWSEAQHLLRSKRELLSGRLPRPQ